jgi:NAD-dependent SIR2 family protein deacetylase
MDMNLRKDANFIQDENWYKHSEMYEEFLDKAENKNLLLIEIGVGFNTPGIIRFPFEQMVYNNYYTHLIRINKDYPMVRDEIQNKSISFNEDTAKIIDNIKEENV